MGWLGRFRRRKPEVVWADVTGLVDDMRIGVPAGVPGNVEFAESGAENVSAAFQAVADAARTEFVRVAEAMELARPWLRELRRSADRGGLLIYEGWEEPKRRAFDAAIREEQDRRSLAGARPMTPDEIAFALRGCDGISIVPGDRFVIRGGPGERLATFIPLRDRESRPPLIPDNQVGPGVWPTANDTRSPGSVPRGTRRPEVPEQRMYVDDDEG